MRCQQSTSKQQAAVYLKTHKISNGRLLFVSSLSFLTFIVQNGRPCASTRETGQWSLDLVRSGWDLESRMRKDEEEHKEGEADAAEASSQESSASGGGGASERLQTK